MGAVTALGWWCEVEVESFSMDEVILRRRLDNAAPTTETDD